MSSHNGLGKFTRKESSITENVLVSQQICNPENIELLLDDKIFYAEKTFKPTQENKSHIQNLKGARAIMRTLLANIEQQNLIIRKSYLYFLCLFSLLVISCT